MRWSRHAGLGRCRPARDRAACRRCRDGPRGLTAARGPATCGVSQWSLRRGVKGLGQRVPGRRQVCLPVRCYVPGRRPRGYGCAQGRLPRRMPRRQRCARRRRQAVVLRCPQGDEAVAVVCSGATMFVQGWRAAARRPRPPGRRWRGVRFKLHPCDKGGMYRRTRWREEEVQAGRGRHRGHAGWY